MTDNPSDNDAASEQSEHRGARRSRMLKAASISFNEKFSAIPCTVRDMSETGIQLQVGNIALVPNEFTVHIPLDGVQVRCRRTWQMGSRLGAEFVAPPQRSNLQRYQFVGVYRESEDAPAGKPADAAKPVDLSMKTEGNAYSPGYDSARDRARKSFGRLK